MYLYAYYVSVVFEVMSSLVIFKSYVDLDGEA